MDAPVLIVGAGPTGLMLACELGLAGVPATVLERAAEPADLPKANGLVGHIDRVFDARGLLDGAPELRPVKEDAAQQRLQEVGDFALQQSYHAFELPDLQLEIIDRQARNAVAFQGGSMTWSQFCRVFEHENEPVPR